MNIAAYCRVSTDKEDQLNSLEAQKAFLRNIRSVPETTLCACMPTRASPVPKSKTARNFCE